MDFIQNIISIEEIQQILEIINNSDSNSGIISIGDIIDLDPELVNTLMSLWCYRIDQIIALDKKVYGEATCRSHQAIELRGFTYKEYSALFNKHITTEQFTFYPIFNQLRMKKGGIHTEKQRTDFTFQYELDDQDYIKCLREQGFDKLLSFFFGGLVKLNAYLPYKMLFRHTYIVASTGSGKSELMRTIFFRMQKKFKKYSLVLIDPHGDLAEKVKRFRINGDNKDRVIYLDPYLKEGHTFTINPFELKDRTTKNINYQGEQIISILEEALNREGSNLSEPMVNTLEKAIYFLLNRVDSSISDLVQLLDGNGSITQEAFEYDEFFNEEFLKPSNKTRTALKARIERFLNSSVLKNLLNGESTFDLENALNSSKIILFNLDGMPEFSQVVIGKIIIARIRSILRKRPKDGKLHTFMFIDECQNFVTESYARILSEMRKYGLHLVLANQFVEQLGKQVNAVKKNTAIKICASDDLDDIKDIIKLPKDASLKNYEFFLKVTGKSLLKFKSPSFLIKNKKKYELPKKEEDKLDELMLSRYYKPIGTKKHNKRIEKPLSNATKKTETSTEQPKKQSPPFRLLINKDD